jgi:hypothetical protein
LIEPSAGETPLPTRPTARRRTHGRWAPGRSLHPTAVDHRDPERAGLEAYIAAAFDRKHGAQVSNFMPTLLAFHDSSGGLKGAVGMRDASSASLYLEQYLDLPVELAIARATAGTVVRGQVVEVGNLAASNCRTAVRMVALLPAWLLGHGYRWITFTATNAVREILTGFGAPLIELARADGGRVAEGAARWGRYYTSDPRVFAGHLPDSRHIPGFSTRSHDR